MSNSDVREGAATALIVTIVSVVIVAIIAVIGVVGWQMNWWFAQKNAERTTQIIHHNNGTQQSYLSAVQNDLTTITSLDTQITAAAGNTAYQQGLQAQRVAIINQACPIAKEIDPSYMTSDVQTFINTDCQVKY